MGLGSFQSKNDLERSRGIYNLAKFEAVHCQKILHFTTAEKLQVPLSDYRVMWWGLFESG